MATRVPAIIQNENLQIPNKGVALKPERNKPPRHKRKALADLSNAPNPIANKPASRGTDRPPKIGILTDDEFRKCHEWAKEGIEHCHFTGGDARRLEEEARKLRVLDEVEMVMASMRSWSHQAFDLYFPVKEASGDLDVHKLELEPEILPRSEEADYHPLLEDDVCVPPVLDFHPIKLKMKDF